MEEKKLNGEEIISALKFAIAQGEPDGIGFWNNDMKWCEFSMCDVLDLIQRQKAEIERLTKENGNISQSYIEVCDINAELQKQVDELTEERENMQAIIFGLEEEKRQLQKNVDDFVKIARVSDTKKLVERDVEDRTKEILRFAMPFISIEEFISECAKIYGVEVDE